MYTPQHFKAYELVDPITYAKFGEGALQFFNPLLLQALDIMRDFFGVPITVNNWKAGGPFKWRGLRTVDCLEGAKWSQHRLGGAVDCDVRGKTADEVRNEIIYNKGFKIITCLEADVNWVHLDVRNIDTRNGILIVRP